MLARSRALFIKEYNNKLFNWLVIFSLVMVVIGRFVVKFFLLEIAAWVMFAFLETYTRMFWSSESLYYNPVWHIVVSTWETIVYSPVLDLDRFAFFFPVTIQRPYNLCYVVSLICCWSSCTDGRSRSLWCCGFWQFIGVVWVEGKELRGRCCLCTMGLTEAQIAQEQIDPSSTHEQEHVHTPLLAGRDFISALSQRITDSFESTWQCKNEHPWGTMQASVVNM